MKRLTVVGARGFLGAALLELARQQRIDAVGCRHDEIAGLERLGTVVYCSGIAWGAQRRPLAAYELAVGALLPIVRRPDCERVVFVSSTKVYDRSGSTAESTPITVDPSAPQDTYAQSKLAGEAIALSASNENRVVRLSNVYGANLRSELFFCDILRQAARTGRIALRSGLDSSKDYVGVDDCARMLLAIAERSERTIYNVASGRNTTHGELLEAIRGCLPFELELPPNAPRVTVPPIEIERIREEYGFVARDVLTDLAPSVEAFVADAREQRLRA